MTTTTTDHAAACAGIDLTGLSGARRESVERAIELGADAATLAVLANAGRLARAETVVLPPQRLETLSRGSGWCRRGRGDSATWGERCERGYRVGPGRWTVGGSDGFSRKRQDTWTVKHVRVGGETWTIAD